jgi:hypothetical protein
MRGGLILRYAGEETVSRFRPLARRRFRTSRPFFVLIRTRKPCVRRRRRRFGWNVRFMIADPLSPGEKWRRNVDSSEARGEVSIVGHHSHGDRQGHRYHCQLAYQHGPLACQHGSRHRCQRRGRVLKSRPLRLRRVSPRSFPQLWKKMLKSHRLRPLVRPLACPAPQIPPAKLKNRPETTG